MKPLISEDYQSKSDHELLVKYIPKTKVYYNHNSKLPKIIHRTGPVTYSDLTPEIKERHRKTQEKLGWKESRYYTDADALIFLKEHFHEYVSEVFQCVNHGAERADLLRYALLYIYGGLYLDLSVEIQKVPQELYTDDILLVEDRPQGKKEGIQIAILSAKPGEIVMLKALCQSIENIMKDSPSGVTLERTGPLMFKEIIPDRPVPLYMDKEGNLILNRDNETIASRYGTTHRNIIRKHYSDDKKFYKIPYNSDRFNFLIGKDNLDEEPDHKEIHTDEIKPHIVLEFTDKIKENKIDNNYIKDLSNIADGKDINGVRMVIGDDKSIDEVNIIRNDYVTKFRKIKDDGGMLLPLDKARHWDTEKDLIPFEKKKKKLFWRGATTGLVGGQREKWCTALFDLGYDVGYSHICQGRKHLKKYVKGKVHKEEFGKYLYVLSLEGNDVASGLVRSLASNSVVLMPIPEKETYLGHSRLKEWEHYVPLNDPKNVGKILQKLDRNPTLVQNIIEKAHLYLMQFYTWDSIYQQGVLNIALERINNLPVKRLCLTYSSIEEIPNSRMEMWKKVLPEGWDIELYGNKECRDFILEHYSVTEWNNFNTLANPVKSDYFRILYLYVKGGMYCDLESVPEVKSFDPYDFFQRGKLTTIKSTHKKEVNPMLMICTKRNLILEECIDIYEKMFRENTSTDIVKMSPLFKKSPDLFYLPFQEKYYKDGHYVLNGKTKILKIRGDDYDEKNHKFASEE